MKDRALTVFTPAMVAAAHMRCSSHVRSRAVFAKPRTKTRPAAWKQAGASSTKGSALEDAPPPATDGQRYIRRSRTLPPLDTEAHCGLQQNVLRGRNEDARSAWYDRAERRTTPRPTRGRYTAALSAGGPGLTRGMRLNPPLHYGP
ncbi:hypothetical protein NDU88_007190 [Pleurodeles waltl]|uniref:Secreted protein n=1 Tax=Pleurodeles waltl TaxID=8319 RepID=A0AAV7SS41_PLEWA|nr:hypothetical protein NDU88_007190 [Pleurodeles waltl]